MLGFLSCYATITFLFEGTWNFDENAWSVCKKISFYCNAWTASYYGEVVRKYIFISYFWWYIYINFLKDHCIQYLLSVWLIKFINFILFTHFCVLFLEARKKANLPQATWKNKQRLARQLHSHKKFLYLRLFKSQIHLQTRYADTNISRHSRIRCSKVYV